MLPALTTDRLLLRPADASDIDVLWRLWTDPEVRRYLWDDRLITREEAAATLAKCSRVNERGLGMWVLRLREAEASVAAPLGCAALLPVSTAAIFEPRLAGLVEPLVALAPPMWGSGYAVEALGALREYASAALRLSRMAAVTDIPNVRSDRMLRRAGFVLLSEVDGPKYPLRTYLCDLATRAPAPAS